MRTAIAAHSARVTSTRPVEINMRPAKVPGSRQFFRPVTSLPTAGPAITCRSPCGSGNSVDPVDRVPEIGHGGGTVGQLESGERPARVGSASRPVRVEALAVLVRAPAVSGVGQMPVPVTVGGVALLADPASSYRPAVCTCWKRYGRRNASMMTCARSALTGSPTQPLPPVTPANIRYHCAGSRCCSKDWRCLRLQRRQRAGNWPGGTTSTRAATSPQVAHSGSARIPTAMQSIIAGRGVAPPGAISLTFGCASGRGARRLQQHPDLCVLGPDHLAQPGIGHAQRRDLIEDRRDIRHGQYPQPSRSSVTNTTRTADPRGQPGYGSPARRDLSSHIKCSFYNILAQLYNFCPRTTPPHRPTVSGRQIAAIGMFGVGPTRQGDNHAALALPLGCADLGSSSSAQLLPPC